MTHEQTFPDLKSRLIAAAQFWAGAHDPEAPLSRLGKRVAGDANFFARIEAPDATLQVATLERFARFLGDAGNWPDGAVPDEVCDFVHVTGVSSAACAASPDSAGVPIGSHPGGASPRPDSPLPPIAAPPASPPVSRDSAGAAAEAGGAGSRLSGGSRPCAGAEAGFLGAARDERLSVGPGKGEVA